MSKKLSLDKISKIINFQRRYRFLRSEINKINERRMFYSDVLLSMVNNLTTCNNSKIFRNTDSLYIKALDELKDIKKELDKISENFSLKNLKNQSINEVNLILIEVSNLIVKYCNHISPENINYILKIFIGDDWINKFDEDDLEKILFLSSMYVPICVWDSEEHTDTVEWENKSKSSKPELLTKDKIY